MATELDNELEEYDIDHDDIIQNPTIDDIEWIVKNHQYRVFRWENKQVTVDAQTANVFMAVYNAINEQNQEKIKRMIKTYNGFAKCVSIAWKFIK